jgi:predicted N-acetyltransferase YhbS
MHPEELPAVHRMLDRAFPNTPQSFFDQQVQADPVLRPKDTRILLENGKIVSCVRVYFREMYCHGKTIKIGGIGDVGTDPSSRHLGYASQLMEDAIQHMRQNQAVLSILFTRIPAFYYQFGFMSLPTFQIETKPPSDLSKIEYRKANLNQDLEQLQKLYIDYNQNKTGPVVRNIHYWKQQLKFPRIDPGQFWVIEYSGEVQCYVRGKIDTDYLKIQEWAYREGQEIYVKLLIVEMARTTHKKKVHLLYLSEQEATLFHDWNCQSKENKALMIRLIQLNKHSSFSYILKPHHFLFWESDRF